MKKKDYILRNDLAIQNKKYKKIDSVIKDNMKINTYSYNSYILKDIIFSSLDKSKLINEVAMQLKYYLKKYKLKRNASCLVVGLGNKNVVSDALGVKTVSLVKAVGTINNIDSNYRNVYTYIPGVFKDTGYMSFVGVRALVSELKPTFIILVDSLISDSVKYLNKVIQLSDMGITPGSGLINYQTEISLTTIGIPVIIIGVATATHASTIIRDAIGSKENHISFLDGYDFVVSVKDIDIIIDDLSEVISKAINKALNSF